MYTRSKTGRWCALPKTFRYALLMALVASLLMPYHLSTAYAEPTSAEVQAEVDEVVAQLAATEAEMQTLREEYVVAVEAHDRALAGMQAAEERIEEAEKRIEKTQEQLGNRANQMYREGPLSYLGVLLGATSFEEFATGWDLVNIVNEENARLIQSNRDARAEALAAHEEYAAEERAAAEYKTQVETAQADAEALVVEQQAILAGLSAELAELVEREQIARLEAEAEAARQNGGNNGGNQNGSTAPPNQVTPETPPNQDPTPSPEPEPAPPPPPPAGGYGDVVAAAASRVGCPYVWGANGPYDFDCSGLTSWCYLQAGRGWIGRTDYDQKSRALASWPYAGNGASPGDVLWWPGHVGIYAGGGTYIHAANPSLGVLYSSWDINSATVLRF